MYGDLNTQSEEYNLGGKMLENYIGKKYGYLTITGVDRERMKQSKWSDSFVFADCDCGVCGKSYNLKKLKTGETKSCGHLKNKHDHPNKINKIEHTETCGIIYVDENPFYYDIEDEPLLINKWWYKDDYGYLTHCDVIDGKNHYTKYHRLVMNAQIGEYVDHIDRCKNNNQKSNLRICTHRENDINRDKPSNNTSGYIGVQWDCTRNKWIARITCFNKEIYLGRYDNIKDALIARLKAEQKYFGEFAPQRDLYEKYLGGINDIFR